MMWNRNVSRDSAAESTSLEVGLPHVSEDFDDDSEAADEDDITDDVDTPIELAVEGPRRSDRRKIPNQRYYNSDLSNWAILFSSTVIKLFFSEEIPFKRSLNILIQRSSSSEEIPSLWGPWVGFTLHITIFTSIPESFRFSVR